MDISEIKKLRAEAMPGPWPDPPITARFEWTEQALKDAKFVQALPEIADECIRLAEENERLEKSLEACERFLHKAIEEGRVKVEIPPGFTISHGYDGNVIEE